MNDERINAKLSIVKRNNLIIISIVSLVFLIPKVILGSLFLNYLTEIYLFVSTGIVLLITLFISSVEEVEDERVVQRINRIYDIGFWFIVLSGLLLYFITLLFYNFSSVLSNFSPNISINIIISICLFLSFIFIRKNKLTFNYRIIEEDKRTYNKLVLTRILYMFLYYVLVAIVVNVIRLFIEESLQLAIILSISIALSFITISIQYFLFSIYEKIHYDELVEKDDGKHRFITRKVMFLSVLNLVVSLLFIFSKTISIMNPLSGSIFQVAMSLLATYLLLTQINFILLGLVMNILIIRSLVAIKLPYKGMIKLFKYIIIFNLIF